MRFQLRARTGHPDFLDLPWSRPLAEWEHERLADVPRGIHRHVVRFVWYEDALYVIKELPRRFAEREYRFLRHLEQEEVPTVDVVGIVVDRHDERTGQPLEAALITRHLEYSLPYRLLFAQEHQEALREPMLDALVDLLVRIHLVGFFWGDCSLSNTLFRRDAGRLAAYVVDTETGELHPTLSDSQRDLDIELAIEKCAGELLDLEAAGTIELTMDPAELADELRARYRDLWTELTRDEVFEDDERWRIHERLRRINELGYDVEEIELLGEHDQTVRLHLSTSVVEPGRDRRRMFALTGLDAQDNQARTMLNDMASFGAWLKHDRGIELPEAALAHRWRETAFEPTIEAIPDDLRGRREPAELYVAILGHRDHLSGLEGRDVSLEEATRSYVETVLRYLPDERTVTAET